MACVRKRPGRWPPDPSRPRSIAANGRARPRPRPPAPALNRTYWTTRLSRELQPLAHDTFAAPRSLGRTVGVVFNHLAVDAHSTVDDLVQRTGLDGARVRTALHRLRSHHLARRSGPGWSRGDDTALDRAADALDVAGYLDDRRARYGNVLLRAGQRRTLAAREAGTTTIPVYIVDPDEATVERIIQQMVENDQREALIRL